MNEPQSTTGASMFANPSDAADYGDAGAAKAGKPTNYYEMIASIDAAEAEVAAAAALLKDKAEALRVLVEEALPAAMRELGGEKVTLPTGETLFIDTGTYASVPKGVDKNKLVEFLDANNEGACVERAFVVGVGKDSAALIEALTSKVLELPAGSELDTKVDVRIPPSSLSAMARRWIDAGRALPGDLISAYTKTVVKVKRPAKK